MIWHPFLISLLVLDTLSLLTMAAAGATAFHIVVEWSPSSASGKQIRLERKAETAWIASCWGVVFFCSATALMIVAIANVLPAVVPGAMCGTGVMQATDGNGHRALGLRFLALAIMSVFMLFNRLNRKHPDSPLTLPAARTILVIVPILVLAYLSTFAAIVHLDGQQPVDCCAVVYDQAGQAAETTNGYAPANRLTAFVAGGLFLCALGLAIGFSGAHSPFRKLGILFGAASILWVPIAYTAFIGTFVSYYYGVLAHHCPWCLFLVEHKLSGYPLFGALAVVTLEGPIAAASYLIYKRFPRLYDDAVARQQAAGKRTAVAAICFLLMACVPPLVWHLRFGVWMH